MFVKYIKQGKAAFCLRLGKLLLVSCGTESRDQAESLFVHPRPDLQRVIREEYLVAACHGRRVLHFGFLDNPITREKISNGTLLHTRIAGVAKALYGVDVDSVNLEEYRRLTGDDANTVQNLLRPESDVSFLSGRFDLILFPEVLEHLANPGAALAKLKEIMVENPGSTLIITVPNAYSLPHFVSACNNIELVHSDHYYYFSPVTLRKLLADSGFEHIDIMLYAHDHRFIGSPGLTEHGVIAICKR